MEVVGYGAAAERVYGPAMEPGDWTTGELLSLQEVRTVRYEAMTPVWNGAPHPPAMPAESPGNWRQRDSQLFPEGIILPRSPRSTTASRRGSPWSTSSAVPATPVPRASCQDSQRVPEDPPRPSRVTGGQGGCCSICSSPDSASRQQW